MNPHKLIKLLQFQNEILLEYIEDQEQIKKVEERVKEVEDIVKRRTELLRSRIEKLEDRSVYFIQAGENGPIKIGVSNDPPSRINQIDRFPDLETGEWVYPKTKEQPEELRLLATIPGSDRTEKAIQNRFKDLHIRGEWFRAEEPLLSFIEEGQEELPEVKEKE